MTKGHPMHRSAYRALIVEDSHASAKLFEAKLRGEGLEVTIASNGPDALERILKHHFDIVFLDLMLPRMDGFEVCQRIKGEPRTAHIPVIIVTALDHESHRDAGFSAGADDFFIKPVEDDELFGRVHALLPRATRSPKSGGTE
jgi:two-component system cell cycle response regulator